MTSHRSRDQSRPFDSTHRSLSAARRAEAPRVAIVLAVTLSVLSIVLAASSSAKASGRGYALLVGTGEYEQWPNLVNPVPDMRALDQLLQQRYGFLVERLENPDRSEILSKLRRYAGREYGPQDQLVIAFAGHGTFDEVTKMGFLAARDSASRARDPNFGTLLDYPRLMALIDRIPVAQILVAVDACYSGSLQGLAGSADPSLVRRFLTSGGAEYTPDGQPDRHSPFMAALLGALDRPGGDRAVTFNDLQGALSEVEPMPRSGGFGRDGGGDLRLVAGSSSRSSQPTIRAASYGSGHETAPAEASAPRRKLRSEPALVSERDLKRAFQRMGLAEIKWNPESDFANEYRQQISNSWDVVLDLQSDLMWQREGSSFRLSPAKAREYVQRLNEERHAGFSDWRLPTLEELGSLIEAFPESNGFYIDPTFDPEQESCWSSDIDVQSRSGYFVSFTTGRVVLAYGNRSAFIRAVRSR